MPTKAEKAVERHCVQLAENIREALKSGVLNIWTHGPDGVALSVHNVDLVLEGDEPPTINIELKSLNLDPLVLAAELTWNEVTSALVDVKELIGFEAAQAVVARHVPEPGQKLADIKRHPELYAALRDDARKVLSDHGNP